MKQLTIKEMTDRYNEMVLDLDLPTVKKLKPTKEYTTVKARFNAMRKQHKQRTANLTPITDPTPTPAKQPVERIKPTRPGTRIHRVIECIIIGGTINELYEMLEGVWTQHSIRAAISWDLPKKGYIVKTAPSEKGLRYQVTNSKVVV